MIALMDDPYKWLAPHWSVVRVTSLRAGTACMASRHYGPRGASCSDYSFVFVSLLSLLRTWHFAIFLFAEHINIKTSYFGLSTTILKKFISISVLVSN